MNSEAKPRVYDLLARAFAQEEVRTCFALLGDANMNWAERLSQQGCRLIYVRHEHCALAAAMAYARKSGAVGVATVTCGPGVTQLITALPAAVRAHLPLVVFAGETPLKSGWYNQEIEQAPLITATGAAYLPLHMPERMPVAVRDAFLKARRERRPVVLGVPFDLQDRPWDGPANLPRPSRELLPRPSPMPPHADDVASAARLLAGAERVVVLAGLGAVEAGAGPACRALAAKTGGLLSTTLPARGLFHDDPFCIGISGSFTPEVGLEYLKQSDFVVAVGCSLAYHAGGGGQLWPKAKMLQIDIDPVAVSQGQEVARHHLRADARLGVEALTAALPGRNQGWRSEAIAARIRDSKPDSYAFEIEPGRLDPRRVVEALEQALPGDWETVNSGGHCAWFFAQMPSRPQARFLTIREFGAIGNGISFAMGVAAARPDRTVVLFDGDGSLMMHVQELETIKRHRLNILIVVMNDGAYGSELHKLRAEGMPEDGSVFGYCDFAGIARGFGLPGKTVGNLDDLPRLVAEFTASGGAAVWDFHVSDKVVSPTMRRAHPQQMPRIRRFRDSDLGAMLAIVNAAAQAYRGVIPADRWHEPYMPAQELKQEIADGIVFWVEEGEEEDGRLRGMMGIQDKGEVALVRHAYVAPAVQKKGVGSRLLRHVESLAGKPVLIGTWAAASWAIDFYRRNGYTVVSNKHKDALLRKYWSIPARQIETSVVLADARWIEAASPP